MSAAAAAPYGASSIKGVRTFGNTRVVHPAVKHLPPPGGTESVVFREPAPDAEEATHQAATPFRQPRGNGDFVPPARVPAYGKEQLREWQYPEYDEKFDDPEFLKEQFRKERNDPRENANFWLDPSDPEFFNNAARRPYAKALLRSEEHWNTRKNLWLEQFDNVRQLNESRASVGDLLEQCTPEMKRLVAPILKYRIVEIFLAHTELKARELNVPFELHLESEEHRETLHDFRRTADTSGARGMEDLYRAWDFRSTRIQLENQEREEKELRLKGGTVGTMEALKDAMNMGSKCKQDGLLEWNGGNVEEAAASWREAHKALYKVRAPDTHAEEGKAKGLLHLAVLKNLAQAAVKLGNWNEALEAADMAVGIDEQDHKAWFRKACALEGLGRLKEAEACLGKIDGIAVGRADRDRIERDTQAKREKLQALSLKDEASQKRMLQGGVKKAIFSEERSTKAIEEQRPGPPLISHKVAVVNVDDSRRKRLPRDAAEDLLLELKAAYRDPAFRKQVRKLAQDVNDQGEFIAYLNRVALPVQRPVLERFGFEGSDLGVAEMRKAVQDHARAQTDGGARIRALAEETMQALYGDFYEVARGVGLNPEHRAKDLAKPRRLKSDGDNSDTDQEETSEPPPCLHWTGRPRIYDAALAGDGRQAAPAAAPAPGGVRGSRRGGEGGAGAGPARNRQGASGEEASQSRPKVTAAERKEIWAELGKAMSGTDAATLRAAALRAAEAGFSAITIRSAKKHLVALGGDVSGLP